MHSIGAFARLALIGGLVSTVAGADVIYDSKGFEEFEGFIDDEHGQDGWFGDSEGVWPYIWTGPPSKGSKSVVLRLNFFEGGRSGMYRFTDDLIAAGYARVTVSFDVYRLSPNWGWIGNLVWSWGDNVDPRAGGQYNLGAPFVSRTYPFIDPNDPFTNDAWVDTLLDAWGKVRLVWDFQAGLASGYYNDVLVSTKHIGYVDAFKSFHLDMNVGEAPLDNHEEWAYIDDFIITADKACYPDFTGDGALDLFDFLAYVNSFSAGEPGADCTADGALDLFDFLCFVNAFNLGC